MLRPAQLDRMRATMDKTFPDVIAIWRLEKVYDGGGGYDEEWIFLEAVPGRVGLPLGGETDERAGTKVRLADEDLYTVWMAAETEVLKTDRIKWENRTFEVLVVLERGNWEIARRLRVKEL